jgi:hypothetical protein
MNILMAYFIGEFIKPKKINKFNNMYHYFIFNNITTNNLFLFNNNPLVIIIFILVSGFILSSFL